MNPRLNFRIKNVVQIMQLKFLENSYPVNTSGYSNNLFKIAHHEPLYTSDNKCEKYKERHKYN